MIIIPDLWTYEKINEYMKFTLGNHKHFFKSFHTDRGYRDFKEQKNNLISS